MCRCLNGPSTLPQPLRKQYDCGAIDEQLSGMLLSRMGVISKQERAEIIVCVECFTSLTKCDQRPPKFAIANGFFVGKLPDHLHDATWIEKIMTQLVTVVAQTRVMRGGRHRSIKSHCMVFDATPGPPATLLPRRVDRNGPYQVILAGPMTNYQRDRVRKLHRARGRVVQELLSFFTTNNPLYSDVRVDQAAIPVDESVCEELFFEHDSAVTTAAIDNDEDSIVSHADDIVAANRKEEETVVEHTLLLTPDQVVANSEFAQRVVDLNNHQQTATPRLRVEHSSRFTGRSMIEAKMHPHLFPFGRGHPDETRLTPVSRRDCLRYYSMLSSRRFARDSTFMLTAFSRLSLENMYTVTSVNCKRNSSMYEGYEHLTSQDLAAALVNNERRQRGQRPEVLSNPLADRFLRSVELGFISVWGSAAERRQCRHEAFAYQTLYGQPSLFVTLTPNTDSSFAIAHYSGILSVQTLFDVLEARTPTHVELKKAVMMDDCASARLFMRSIDAFIVEVLGFDPKTKTSSKDGGLFGGTKAYYGMVETQGRGTLHIHFLIWLEGLPVNSVEFEQKMDEEGPAFMERLEKYVDSIVTTEFPLETTQLRCSRCGAVSNNVALAIPVTTRRNKPYRRDQSEDIEPTLIKCSSCGLECSPQHILRHSLLTHRPPYWPPPMRPLSPSEKLDQIQRERVVRSSFDEAQEIIENRDVLYTSVRQTESDEISTWILHLNDSPRRKRVILEDDPFRRDPMNRLIEMLPPSPDTSRMSHEHASYMLASLVLNLNTHSWTHTGSCFKSSRATSSASMCRYGFPRDRQKFTSIAGPKVELKRDLAHEYVNGYNPTVMASFKCNHDIQILFGGKDAINRIYYCCKYVTKSQKQIDSSTAVALASFQRRQAKEVLEFASEQPPNENVVRRRRVTGMVHTFTNKQEIAGPLAALYILRGSCCYSSRVCVKLPLSDVLKQLQACDEYGCVLVRSRQDQDTVFRPASYLDDYIYRPPQVTCLSLYEFAKQCYRRQLSPTTPTNHRFHPDHPLSASHCTAFRRIEAVPVIKGPRLGRFSSSMRDEEKEEYAKTALVLLKPFRALEDLVQDSQCELPWFSAYEDWKMHRSDFVKTIMHNMDDYHIGRDAEREAVLENNEHPDDEAEDAADSDCSSIDDGFIEDDCTLGEDDLGVDTFHSEFLDDMNEEGDSIPVFPAPLSFPSRIQAVIGDCEQHRLVHSIADSVVHTKVDHSLCTRLTARGLRGWIEDTECNSRQRLQVDSFNRPTSVELPTRVNEIIDECLTPEGIQWHPHTVSTTKPQARPFCSIIEMSRVYTLNKLQHGAFALIASHLLRRWRVLEGDETPPSKPDNVLYQEQLRMFLGGEGGTGKSRVIQAIRAFCRSWSRPGSIVVTAMTGKAATLVCGQTLASFEMSLKKPDNHVLLQDVDCLIVDEVSMMSKEMILRLDRLLRKAKRIPNVPFGGLHVVFVGDFLQLPPVGADPIFIDPVSKKKVTLQDFEGFHLWRKFDKVVVLRESVRFKDDPQWGEGCSKARLGIWTPESVSIINSRVIGQTQSDAQSPSDPPIPSNSVFVTPDNETRTAINSHFIQQTGKQLLPGDLPIRIVANFKGALNNLSHDDISKIMGMPDTSFGRMAPYLDLICGMPIQITQNVCTKKGVANGTMGHLHSIQFPPGTEFRLMMDTRLGISVRVPDKRPLFALVQLNRGPDAIPISDDISPDLFPVFPDCEPFSKSVIKLTPSSTGEPRSLSIRIQQFPFICAVGATVYKVQGESLRSMVIVDWKVDVRGANRPQQAYLMVSRVVTRQGLVCLKTLTETLTRWARPPLSAINEDERLARESDRTLASFYSV